MAIPTPQTKRVARLCAALPHDIQAEIVALVRHMETTLHGVRAGRDLLLQAIDYADVPGSSSFVAFEGTVWLSDYGSSFPGDVRPGAYRPPDEEVWLPAWVKDTDEGRRVYLVGSIDRVFVDPEPAAQLAAGAR